MGVVFKYKNKINQSYNPGFVNAGEDGSVGKEGENGNTVHFIDYDIDNSYYLELTLQKIENEQLLTSSSSNENAKLLSDYNKPNYKLNDIIISNTGTCYKLVKSSDKSLFKNFSYEIEKLGKFNTSNNVQTPLTVVLFNTTTYRNGYSCDFMNSCYPNHSCINANSDKDSSFYDNDLNDSSIYLRNKCVCFELACLVNDNVPIDELSKNYSYSLEINLANFKQMDFGEDPVKSFNEFNSIKFYKKLEFSNLRLMHMNDAKPENLKKYYFVDFNFDSIHPSNNNIKCTLDKNKWMWLNSKLSEKKLSDVHYSIKSKDIAVGDEDEFILSKVLKDNYIKVIQSSCGNAYLENNVNLSFYDSSTGNAVKLNNFDSGFDTNWYPEHAVGGSLIANTKSDIQNAIDFAFDDVNKNGDIFKFSTHICSDKENKLSGNSLYFSSINDSNDENFTSEIVNYILNPENKCYLKTTDLRTKRMSISEVNLIIK